MVAVVSEKVWRQRMANLREHRKVMRYAEKPRAPYGEYLKHLRIGQSVLDVGCGRERVRQFLPEGVRYVGLDPFPIAPGSVKATIEECEFAPGSFDTLVAFAVLDGVRDLPLALSRMNSIAAGNIGLLTGLDVPVDQYHTHTVTMKILLDELPDFRLKFKQKVLPRAWLMDWWRA